MLDIKVLGPGCANCNKLENLVREIVNENDIPAKIEKITDSEKFPVYGVFLTPGLVVNGKVIVSGKIPSKLTLEQKLKDIVVKP